MATPGTRKQVRGQAVRRELVAAAQDHPSSGRWRIFIMEDADRMSGLARGHRLGAGHGRNGPHGVRHLAGQPVAHHGPVGHAHGKGALGRDRDLLSEMLQQGAHKASVQEGVSACLV